MAKKKDDKNKEIDVGEVSLDDLIVRLRDELNKEYKTDICTSGLDVVNNKLQVVKWCPSLDAALGGGVLEGTWISISGPPKLGKAQPLYSTVYTKNGPKLMKDIIVGDEVCSPDGTYSKVLALFPQGKQDIYRIYFCDGDYVDCTKDHLWNIKSTYWNEFKTLPLEYLLDKNLSTSNGKYKNRKHIWQIQLPTYIEFAQQKLELDPYILGLLLGDGGLHNKSQVKFTNTDLDIVENLQAKLKKYQCKLRNDKHDKITYTVVKINQKKPWKLNKINRLITKLDLRKLSIHKSIPKSYLYSSYQQRLELIRGLMDTDGYINKEGTACNYYTSSIELAAQFKFLINSIGGLCSITHKYTTCNNKIFKSYNCKIRLNNFNLLFKCKRKLSRTKHRLKNNLTRKIKKIENIGRDECQCIKISNPNGLYITDNCIVTHNTASAMKLAVQMQKAGKPVFFLSPEGRLKSKDLMQVKDLDLSPNKFIHIHSTVDHILTTQDYLITAERILKTVPGCFIVIDSVSALADEKELEGGIGTQTRGHNYQVISQFINNVAQLVPVTKSIVAGIIHKIANTSGMGAASTEKACNRWKYQADIQLEVKYIDKWKSGENIIGQILHWHCKSSSLGRPFIDTDSYLRYGIGIDDVYETMKFGEACALINKSGAWYELSFLENYPELYQEFLNEKPSGKLQGGEAVWDYLNTKPQVLETLQKELLHFASSLVKSSGD